jgi:hypothetical protein
MDKNSESPSPLDLAGEAGSLVVGLTTVTIQFFPFALPLLILVIAPLALLGLAAAVLLLPIMLPLWIGRRILRTRLSAPPHSHPQSAEGTSGARGRRPIGPPPSAGPA